MNWFENPKFEGFGVKEPLYPFSRTGVPALGAEFEVPWPCEMVSKLEISSSKLRLFKAPTMSKSLLVSLKKVEESLKKFEEIDDDLTSPFNKGVELADLEVELADIPTT